MKIPYYQIDAFITDSQFSGNPAGVCLLKEWLPDNTLQNIAFENNLSETAFIIDRHDYYELRWFTPTVEVDLCGHATLAPAYLILKHLHPNLETVKFKSCAGELIASKTINDMIEINFPSRPPESCKIPKGLIEAIGLAPSAVYKSRDHVLIYNSEKQVRSISPNMFGLGKVKCFGVIVTSVGDKSDFVSRFFAPSVGVPEDPVTGSAHSTLIPYWANRLKKNKLHAYQLSQRGGELFCNHLDDRVSMAGQCKIHIKGEICL